MKFALLHSTIFLFSASCMARADATSSAQDNVLQELNSVGVAQFTSQNYKPGIVRHVVLFRYAESVSEREKEEIKQHFLKLKNTCIHEGKPYIVSIESGEQISGEGVDNQMEQGFIVTFKSEGDRNFYVGSPVVRDPKYFDRSHQAFKEFVGPFLHTPIASTGVTVFDFRP